MFKFRRSAKKDQAIGSSRGAKNTKVHVLVNEKIQLMSVILTEGNVHDLTAATLMAKLFSPTELTLPSKSVIISKNGEPSFVSLINSTSKAECTLQVQQMKK